MGHLYCVALWRERFQKWPEKREGFQNKVARIEGVVFQQGFHSTVSWRPVTQRVVKMLKERWSWVSGSFVLCGIMEGRVSDVA